MIGEIFKKYPKIIKNAAKTSKILAKSNLRKKGKAFKNKKEEITMIIPKEISFWRAKASKIRAETKSINPIILFII